MLGLFLGPLLAITPILIWELGLKPRQQRIQLAKTLLRELLYNRLQLETYEKIDPRTSDTALPSRVSCSTVAFEALATHVGELASATASEVILLYNQLSRFNLFARDYDTIIEQINTGMLDPGGMARYQVQRDMIVEAVRDQRLICLKGIEMVLNALKPLLSNEERKHVGPPRNYPRIGEGAA